MHIEFEIPRVIAYSSEFAHSFKNRAVRLIKRQVNEWAAKYNTTIDFTVEESVLCVKFKEDKYYTMFSLTWRPEPAYYATAWDKIRIVDAP